MSSCSAVIEQLWLLCFLLVKHSMLEQTFLAFFLVFASFEPPASPVLTGVDSEATSFADSAEPSTGIGLHLGRSRLCQQEAITMSITAVSAVSETSLHAILHFRQCVDVESMERLRSMQILQSMHS